MREQIRGVWICFSGYLHPIQTQFQRKRSFWIIQKKIFRTKIQRKWSGLNGFAQCYIGYDSAYEVKFILKQIDM